MKSKKCLKCSKRKSISEFPKHRTTNHPYCKPCFVEYRRTWHRDRRGLAIKLFLIQLKMNTPCVDCGRITLTAEYDHIKDTKSYNLSRAFMVKGMTIEQVKEELAKCELRCAECHRIKTHIRQNSWLSQFIVAERNGTIDQLLSEIKEKVNK